MLVVQRVLLHLPFFPVRLQLLHYVPASLLLKHQKTHPRRGLKIVLLEKGWHVHYIV